jgi:23S rRNA pseudouridine1911/1915/1917 synthase
MVWKKTEMGVIHYVATQNGPWKDLVSEETSISIFDLDFLHGLGSVYYNDQRLTDHPFLKIDDYLRIHSHPRRFPFTGKIPIVFENEDLIILDKPSGIPCHPTVDNTQENLMVYFKMQTGLEIKLTHRLDVPTSGLIVFAKTKSAQSEFHKILQSREVEKIYLAEVSAPGVSEGLYEHHMLKTDYAPKEIRENPTDQTSNCLMKVLENKTEGDIAKLRIQLLTGRTHQIRAQLNFLGFPIIGDSLYRTGSNAKPDEKIELRCISLKFPWKSEMLQIKIDN